MRCGSKTPFYLPLSLFNVSILENTRLVHFQPQSAAVKLAELIIASIISSVTAAVSVLNPVEK